jgi:heat shock protein HslJ
MKNFGILILVFVNIFSYAYNTGKITAKPEKKALSVHTQTWIIDAVRAKCEGKTTQYCLLVKKPGDKDFNLFYGNIIGFDFEEGFVYTIRVREELKTPPIAPDESIYNYILVKIVSKKTTAGTNIKPDDINKSFNELNLSKTKTLIINEDKITCEGNPDAKCLLIKQSNSKEFEVFYQNIVGFNFEEGYRQTILVSERQVANPNIKQTEPVYTLIKVLKKDFIFEAKKLSAPFPDQPKTPLDKKWYLRKMKESDTTSFEIDDNGVFLEIRSAENKVNGKAPCNTYFGGLKTDFISSFQVVTFSTRMYCENMKLEDLYLNNLQNANRYELKEGRLILYKDDKLLLVFN